MPQRIQRQRTKGWRMPENTIYVGRGSVWGNPFHVGQTHMPAVLPHEVAALRRGCFVEFSVGGRPGIPLVSFGEPLSLQRVISLYRGHAVEQIGPVRIRDELRGRNLACWCSLDQPCHADVLLELANAPHCEEIMR